MNEAPVRERIVDISHGISWLQRPGPLNRLGFAILERVLGYHHINRLFERAATTGDPEDHYLKRLLEVFEIETRIEGDADSNWPEQGPVIVVANHPFGGADATAVGALAFGRRSDTRILANEFLGTVEPLRDSLIAVDVYGGESAARKNRRGLRETAEHLRDGGQLVMFPAGEVAHWSWREKATVEPPWADHVVAFARRFGATIVPIFVEGRNSRLFQFLGMIDPFLRTTWLGREFLNKRKKQVKLVIRQSVTPDDLDEKDPVGQLRHICLGRSEGDERRAMSDER